MLQFSGRYGLKLVHAQNGVYQLNKPDDVHLIAGEFPEIRDATRRLDDADVYVSTVDNTSDLAGAEGKPNVQIKVLGWRFEIPGTIRTTAGMPWFVLETHPAEPIYITNLDDVPEALVPEEDTPDLIELLEEEPPEPSALTVPPVEATPRRKWWQFWL